MNQYTKVAINAIDHMNGETNIVKEWNNSLKELEINDKSCPRCAFLGLCEDGYVKNVPKGKYTSSKLNKQYAIKALEIFRKNTHLTKKSLWKKVLKVLGYNISKYENGQISIVVDLYKNGYLK